jgi:urea transporter
MKLSVVEGAVIDLAVDFTLSGQFEAFTQVVATAVVGTVYYLALDGPSSNTLVPVGVPTTS